MKYLHTNIIAKDWRKLADFYINVFSCKEVSPKRDLKGEWIEKGTGVAGACVEGIHLRLPGHGDNGPTLEIFQYNKSIPQTERKINAEGFAHIAFYVEDVEKILQNVIDAGGSKLSNVVKEHLSGIGLLTFVYAKDPEGNFIELQRCD